MIVGKPLDRVDGRAKVTGAAKYAADQPVPGLAHAVLVTSTIARGRITRTDTDRAARAPGVLSVVTHHNGPRFAHQPPEHPWVYGQTLVPLQDDVIHHSGQIVAVVIADTLERARYAATLVQVDYMAEKPDVSLEANLDRAFVPEGGPFGLRYEYRRGDPHGALAQAPVRVSGRYKTSMQHHNPIEPAATTAVWSGDHLTLYETTQALAFTQPKVAEMLGIDEEHVRVISPYLGGGFGCKGYVWPHTFIIAAIARNLGRPVKLVLTRAQSYTMHGHRAETIQELAVGANRDGKITVFVHNAVSQTSMFNDVSWEDMDATTQLYACPNAELIRRVVRLNLGTPTPMRAPSGVGGYALEAIMDELSHTIGVNPLEVRLRNYSTHDPENPETPWGTGKFLRDCYRLGSELFDWPDRLPKPRSTRRDGHWIGIGMATAFHPTYVSTATVTIRLGPDGAVLVRSATQDIGTGTYTIITQVVADALGASVESVHFELGDTTFARSAPGAGSRTAASVGTAAHHAGTLIRDKVIAIAVADPRSPLYRVPAAHVAVAEGRLFHRMDPRRHETYADIVRRHGAIDGEATWPAGTQMNRSYGAVFAEVRVDVVTGEVRVTRLAGAFDIGRVLNAKTARSQAVGGMIWGLGTALTEHTLVDEHLGRILTPNLSGYLVPVEADVPDVDVAFVDKADPLASEIGARGIGELASNGATAAIANAVFHATGRRVRDLPITPDTLI
ncbi:xanthine dehydrogenase family protein molybdopterin-binding subunit [Kibdelosporangium aridum]|uniref:Xanthine dehydrogenase family protein molybdopterin-binding subunit n=1 Tax=Kibdelosporangium aridum TaxID=2030 RepID=A0A428ZE31_KIBAR|nr:xanthine dehydrogenase family protein molybdopterin-binding subunit [Kibdelosporangium aridum]RSM86319.1 xanthine dehydrogenase family protein molybdopterin-binding subunit [Kibdelosporangium aridum]